MSSALEAECGALFVNVKEDVVFCTTLAKLGHPKQPTPTKTDNSTASGIANDTICQRRSCTMDMCYY